MTRRQVHSLLSLPRQEREESVSNGHTCLPLIITLLSFNVEGAIMTLWTERERTRDLFAEKQQYVGKKTVRANPIKASLTENRLLMLM